MKRENLERRPMVECVWQTYLGGTFKKFMIRKASGGQPGMKNLDTKTAAFLLEAHTKWWEL
jgi:hypothetical protein